MMFNDVSWFCAQGGVGGGRGRCPLYGAYFYSERYLPYDIQARLALTSLKWEYVAHGSCSYALRGLIPPR